MEFYLFVNKLSKPTLPTCSITVAAKAGYYILQGNRLNPAFSGTGRAQRAQPAQRANGLTGKRANGSTGKTPHFNSKKDGD